MAAEYVMQLMQETYDVITRRDYSNFHPQITGAMLPKHDVILKELLSNQCYSNIMSYDPIISKSSSLIRHLSQEDVFFTWINDFTETSDGTLIMNVCLYSFPDYSEMERKLKLNVEKKKFLARLERDMILKPSVWNQNETEKLVKEVKSTLYHPIDHIQGNEIIISNFRFKRERKNNGHWIIDGIT